MVCRLADTNNRKLSASQEANPERRNKMREDNEPSLEKLDDYNGNESPQKRRTIWLVVIAALIIGAIFASFEMSSPKKDLVQSIPKSDAK